MRSILIGNEFSPTQRALVEADLQAIQVWYSDALAHAQFVWREDRYALSWSHTTDLGGVLWPIGYAAGELLQSEELRLMKHCPSCGWLFLDRSKNGQRRWCSMNSCGVRAKMQQYHQRRRNQNV